MCPASQTEPLAVLLGAGPGAPGLVTAEGVKWLRRADVVIYDKLANPALLALAPAAAERVYVGKAPGEHAASQQQISELLVDRCRPGRVVVRLKGGDPLVFGRGGEEAEALAAAAIPFRIVPGVTAAVAAAAFAGIPLTDRRHASTVALVTGHEDPAKDEPSVDYAALARIDTVVFYMGVANLAEIARRLIEAGRDPHTPAAAVEQATTPRQRTVTGTLATLGGAAERAGLRPPAAIIVGQVAAKAGRLAWFERLPLFGRTVLVTRPAEQSAGLAERLDELGAEVIEAPAAIVEPPADPAPVEAALRRLGEFDWLVLTSANGVEALASRLETMGLDARALGGVRLAAVGAATAEALRRRFLRADLVPETYTTKALADALVAAGAGSSRLLLARADIATPELPDALRRAGAAVEQVCLYRAVCPPALPPAARDALRAGRADWITFTSASTVENFLALSEGADLSQARLAAIGPVTAEAIRRRGLAAAAVAQPHTAEGLVAAILAARDAPPR